MGLGVVGFADKPQTRAGLQAGVPLAQFWENASGECTPPDEGDLLVVVHMNQLPDGGALDTGAHSCARDCVLAWAQVSDRGTSGRYASYVGWVLKYHRQIRAMAVTTGGRTFGTAASVYAAREAARGHPVAFVAPAEELGELLAVVLSDDAMTDPIEIVRFLESGPARKPYAAQQVLTAAWVLQLEWESAGRFPIAEDGDTEGMPRTLGEKTRAYLTGSVGAQDVKADRLARALSAPSALAALDQLKNAQSRGEDWHEWNRLLEGFRRSWVGED
jgi:hypothetical protein